MSIERGSLLLQTGRFAEAEQEFRVALFEEPSNALGHALIGVCMLHQKNYRDADTEARQAIALRPDWYLGYAVLSDVLSDRERIKPALGAIGKAIELNPFDPNLHASLAQLRLKQRDWTATLEAADAGLQINPEHTGCLNFRSIALVKLGRPDEAGATLKDALQQDPHNAVSHANQGWALLHSGEYKGALIHFRESLRIDPNLDWAKAGIVEAMKARNIVYRMMLRYFLFMSRMSFGVQWAIIIGAMFGQQALFALAAKYPAVAPFVLPIMLAYLGFILLSWLATPLFNLMLRLDRFGRYALSRNQTVSSNWVGGLLLAALVLLVIGLIRGDERLEWAAMLTAILSMPMTSVFKCPRGWPRWVMAGYAAGLAAVMLFFAATPYLHGWDQYQTLVDLREHARNAITWSLLVTGVLANILMTVTVKR